MFSDKATAELLEYRRNLEEARREVREGDAREASGYIIRKYGPSICVNPFHEDLMKGGTMDSELEAELRKEAIIDSI